MQNTYVGGEAKTMLFQYKTRIIHQKMENFFILHLLALLAISAFYKRLNVILLIFYCK